MITILYFGVLKQRLQTTQEQLAWEGGTGKQLLSVLQARGGKWASALQPDNVFRLVINKRISSWQDWIPTDAEVGLLPPVTGG